MEGKRRGGREGRKEKKSKEMKREGLCYKVKAVSDMLKFYKGKKIFTRTQLEHILD